MQNSYSVFTDTIDDLAHNAIQASNFLGQRSHPRLLRRWESLPQCRNVPNLPSITNQERSHTVDVFRQLDIDSQLSWSQLQRLGSSAGNHIDHSEALHATQFRIVVREPERDAVKQSILIRLKELHAASADEDMTISPESEHDFRLYVLEQMRPNRRPSVTLLENGNLRAYWCDSTGQQVGLQFRGDGWLQYVLFARTMPDQTIATSVGRKTFGATIESVRQMGLNRLIYA